MNLKIEKEIAKDIFELSEESIYKILENLNDTHGIDQSLVYCFVKAFYLHITKLYGQKEKLKFDFDDLYAEYKENLKVYYQNNNPNIEEGLLKQILSFFENSFALLETVEFTEIEDSYEFRHYVIRMFELLKIILVNKSKTVIRENIFENDIKIVIEQVEKIKQYLKK